MDSNVADPNPDRHHFAGSRSTSEAYRFGSYLNLVSTVPTNHEQTFFYQKSNLQYIKYPNTSTGMGIPLKYGLQKPFLLKIFAPT
jgi:hypothetical protein